MEEHMHREGRPTLQADTATRASFAAMLQTKCPSPNLSESTQQQGCHIVKACPPCRQPPPCAHPLPRSCPLVHCLPGPPGSGLPPQPACARTGWPRHARLRKVQGSSWW
eukprot:1158962-Pelagomonas_calceolata.AAC.3